MATPCNTMLRGLLYNCDHCHFDLSHLKDQSVGKWKIAEKQGNMPSTALKSSVEDKIDRKKKRKELQTNESCEDGIQPDTDIKIKKKERLKSKEKRTSTTNFAADQLEQTFQDDNNSDESSQQTSSLVDEQPAVLVKKKKKKQILEDSESLSMFQDVNDCENASGSPAVLENKEKKKKKKKKRKEDDTKEERNDLEESHDNGTRTKKKKKTMIEKEEHVEPEGSDHSPLPDGKNGGGDSLMTCVTEIGLDDKEGIQGKKKKKRKRRKSSPDLNASDKHENVTKDNDDCDEPVHKIKKKKKRKREEQESDSVRNAEEEQEEKVKVKSSGKKKKKREHDDGNSVDDDDSQLPHSKTAESDMFKHAVFESAKRESQFSRVTGKPAKLDDNDLDKNELNSSSKERSNIEEKPTPVRGQWQGALFENEERQSKFLRLLGGMKSVKGDKKNLFSSQNSSQKKGLYGSLSASLPNLNNSSDHTAANTKGGKALCVSDAATINKRLEEDYNKAMNFRLSGTKGAGLGFAPDPAEGKKFHIDANSTKSVKFDNDDD